MRWVFLIAVLTMGCSQTESARGQKDDAAPDPRAETQDARLSRDPIKWATDMGAEDIDAEPVETTIEELLAFQRPADLADDNKTQKYQELRILRLETTVWKVRAHLKSLVVRDDGDLYIVLEDDNGHTMVSECPNLDDCATSRFYKLEERARLTLESKFHPTMQPTETDTDVVLTGIGFFGRATEKEGAHHNGARLMPLLEVVFP